MVKVAFNDTLKGMRVSKQQRSARDERPSPPRCRHRPCAGHAHGSTLILVALGALVLAGTADAEPTVEASAKQGELSQKEMFGGRAETARSPRSEALPKELNGVGIEERLGAKLPLDLEFVDTAGDTVRLGDILPRDKPVFLTLNYSDCPMLCSVMLNGLVDGLEDMNWTIGQEFELVTVSLDPEETPERALSTKERYLSDYGRDDPHVADGWHFLVGDEKNIRALADSIGFGYRYSESRQEYLHAAGLVVLNPEATISRYLYGVTYSPKTMRLSLAEASDGKFASTLDQLILFCFHYDETEGRYAPIARNIMMLGGAATVMILALFLGGFWMSEARKAETNATHRHPKGLRREST